MPSLAVFTASVSERFGVALDAVAGGNATGIVVDARSEVRSDELGETGRREFLKRIGDRGLRVAALHFPLRRAIHDPADFDRRIDALKAAMRFAHDLGARTLLVKPGRIPDEDAPRREVFLGVLDDLARFGNHVGCTLALQTGQDDPAVLRAVCDGVSQGLIGVDLDPASLVLGGHDPVAAVRTLHDRLMHVRLRDAVREGESGGSEVPVGRGDVRWDEFLATLNEAAYRQWLTAERTVGGDRGGDVLRALAYARALLPES